MAEGEREREKIERKVKKSNGTRVSVLLTALQRCALLFFSALLHEEEEKLG